MRFFSTIAIVATFVASALAQAPLAFTTLPSSVTAGKPFVLKWAGGDGSPVTLILKKGKAEDLQTVNVISGSAPGNSFTWTPSTDLFNGDDYALSISQGEDTINYTGQFSIVGGKDESATIVIHGSTTFSLTAVSTTSTVTSSSANKNATIVTTTTFTSTSAALLTGTAPGASGTGASVHRNTTFSSATLSSTGSRSTSSATGSKTGSGTATGSTTGSAAASTSTAAAARAVVVAQGAAFGGLGALVALMAMF